MCPILFTHFTLIIIMGLKELKEIFGTFAAYKGYEFPTAMLQSLMTKKGSTSAFHGVDVMARHWFFLWIRDENNRTVKEGEINGTRMVKAFRDLLLDDMMLPGRNNTVLWYIDDKAHTPQQKYKEQDERDKTRAAAMKMYPAADEKGNPIKIKAKKALKNWNK